MADFPLYNLIALSKKVLFIILFAYFASKVINAVEKLNNKEIISHSFYFLNL